MLNNDIKAGIFGIKGTELLSDEIDFFKKVNPLGFILFTRNIENKEQVKKLTADLKKTVSHTSVPILIDQEGGRVQRLLPPIWRQAPNAEIFGKLFLKKGQETAINAVKLNTALIASELTELGINVNCLPVIDVPVLNAHNIIGDRAFSDNPDINTILGKAVIDSLLEHGIFPIVKHIPGHGRAFVDSHENLPIVDTDVELLEKTDFKPFKELSDSPWAMTAHVVFSKIDKHNPATMSPVVINQTIREYIRFRGFLISDDLSMKALSGSFAEKTIQSLDAGCDAILHCNGNMQEMLKIAEVLPPLSEQAQLRLIKADRLMSTFPQKKIKFKTTLNKLENLLA